MYSVAVHHVHMHGVRAALLTVHTHATQGQECTLHPPNIQQATGHTVHQCNDKPNLSTTAFGCSTSFGAQGWREWSMAKLKVQFCIGFARIGDQASAHIATAVQTQQTRNVEHAAHVSNGNNMYDNNGVLCCSKASSALRSL